MGVFELFLFLVLQFSLGSARKNYEDRPRIYVSKGHLQISVPPDRNISFLTTGEKSGISINNIDVLTTLNKAHNATKLTESYQRTLSFYNDRLDALEQKFFLEPIVINNSSNASTQLVTKQSFQKLNRRVRFLNQRLLRMELLLYKDECSSNPCKNGGRCQDMFDNYLCRCSDGWEGKDCTEDVNECARFSGTDLGCQNGASCVNKPGTYECICVGGFVGIHCTKRKADCLSGGTELCDHGTCVSQNNALGYKCICDQGWTTDGTNQACSVDVNECKMNHPPCSVNPHVECINVPGSFYCASCPQGFTGNGYHCSDIDECAVNNGGCSANPMVLCINTHGSRVCGLCPPGYMGDGVTCSYRGVCNVNNGGCHPSATCRDNPRISSSFVECICPAGYIGNGIGPNGCLPTPHSLNPCSPNPCKNGRCSINNSTGDYTCTCRTGYGGRDCDVITRDPCNPNPCMNNGECQNVDNYYVCKCKAGFSGRLCQIQRQACGGYRISENGTLKYPSGELHTYNHRSNCAWKISSNSTSRVLNITIKLFDIEESSGCLSDWLEIHDGPNTAAHSLGRFCGSKLPLGGNFITSHNSIYLWFRSDTDVAGKGFELSWQSVEPNCGGTIKSTHGSIQSPGSPGNYPLNRDCYWRLYAPFGKRFMFQFFMLDIGENPDCDHDYLKFYSLIYAREESIFEKFCNSTKPAPFYSSGSRVVVHFHSDNENTYQGFQLTYTVVEGTPGCGGVYTAPEGVIQSIQSADNVYTFVCEYKIQQSINNRIKISFLNFDLGLDGECTYNFVEIHEGPDEESPSIGRYCGTKVPSPYISTGNQLTIVSSSITPVNGWKIEYEKVCGASYTTETGSFSGSRLDGSNCIYQIDRPPGNVIILILKVSITRFYTFGRSSSINNRQCFPTYIEVRDGDHDNATLIGKYCNEQTINITSTHNSLWMKLVNAHLASRSASINPVFTAQYTSVDIGCGGIIRKKFGTISSPTADGNYPPSSKCTWVLIAPAQNVIQLTWMTFNVEESHDCSYDNVQVFDNNTDLGMGGSMGRFCGFTLPPILLSSSNIMTIVFTTDVTINMDGFLASYTFIPEHNVCGGSYFTPAGIIKSPGYPGDYPTNRECTWVIHVQPGQQIMLNVTDFNIETYSGCRYDWLEIRNGATSASPLIGKYCGTDIPKQIPSHANKLYLYFKSDLSRSGHGFKISWTSAATGCGGVLTSPTGSIISPHYPEPYSRNTECLWKIITSTGSRIQVIFSDIDLEKHVQCLADYVQLLDGLTPNSNSLGKFCSEGIEPIRSSGNKMLVKFRSDVAFQGRGFQLQYTTVCHNTVKGYRGVIESPNFPNDYPQDEDCLWEIVVSDRNKINITFSHFELERSATYANNSCLFDYVEISYAEPPDDYEENRTYTNYGKYCGDKSPGHLSLNSDHVRIHFVSDKLLLGSGFRLEWEMDGCGGHLKRNSGTITSPNYPNSYPVSVVCEWLIEVDFGNSIEIEFHEVDIEKDTSCDFDSIKLFNGPDDTYNLLSTICRQKKTSVISSTGNVMLVRFQSDYSYQGKGFTANYTTTPTTCGGKFTAMEGKIFSPNYPKNYNKNETCEYFIEVDDGHSIELKFEDVDLFTSSNCSRNYVKVHDGPSAAYPVLATVCGNETPNNTIKSTYNHLFVEFRSHSYFTTKGFSAKYSKACGSRITTQDTGIIRIDQDEFSESLQTCTWTIVSEDPSKHVSLTISQMHGQVYCDWGSDPVKIYNGESTESPLLKKICGSKVPPTLVSDGSALTVLIDTPISFFATYSVYDSQCGGTLMSSEGYFSTPGYPKKYASDTQCEWTITISPGNHVTLNFIHFELLESQDCNSDFLEIRSNNSSGPVLGTFCGNNKPDNITHVGSLWLLYKGSKLEPGDGPITAKGFYAEYQLNDYNELTGRSGEIYSPLYPLPFLEYKTFSWRITVRNKKRILLSFKEFYLDAKDEIDDDCFFAVFEVFDGVDETALSLGRMCGLTLPNPIKSSSNIMFIRVEYNSARLGSKFIVEWEEIEGVNRYSIAAPKKNTTCGLSEDINVNAVGNYTFQSPGYPYGYAPNIQCEWTFSTIPMNHLTIKFLAVDLRTSSNRIMLQTQKCNSLSDYVRLFQRHSYDNNWQVLRDVCKHEMTPFTATEFLKVQFVTTRYFNGTGFKAIVEEECGGYLREPTGYIIFNNSTPRSHSCTWNITVRSTRTIELVFEEMNIQHDKNKGCDNYIMVRNGKYPDSPILGSGKYCGSQLPENLKSTGNNLFVKFSGVPKEAIFRIKYQEVSASCGGEILLSTYDNYTEISSPNYPNIPSPHIECQWLIRSPSGESLRIDFEERFDLTPHKNCEKEYVEIRDGGTEFSKPIGKYCTSMPSSQFSTDNMVFIKFFTDIDDPKNGFKAKISIARCGGTLRGERGELKFSTPTKDKNINCIWNVVGLADHYLNVSFSQLDIKESANCTGNFVALYENLDPSDGSNATMLGKYCGKKIPAAFTTSSNKMVVKYAGDDTGKFIMAFSSSRSKCGGILNEESGLIQSPGYPVMNHMNRFCRWTIRVPEGRRVTLDILDWDMDMVDGKSIQSLDVYDGRFSPRIAIVNSQTRRTIESSSNEMVLVFYSARPSEHRGFRANFSSYQPTVCVGDFTKASGVIITPKGRNSSYNCFWTHNTKNLNLNQTTALAISIDTNYNLSTSILRLCQFAQARILVTNEESRNVLHYLCSSTERPVIVRSPFLITKLQATVGLKNYMNFTATYSTHQCGGIVHSQKGYISSPNFPNKPLSAFECAWLLKVDKDQTINVTILSMNLGDDCDKSFLTLYNGGLPIHPRIGKYCRNNKPETIISQSDKVWIEYRHEQGSTGNGFQLQYEATSTGCGGIFHDRSRIIQSPNYNKDYPNNAECLWIINASPGYHLKLSFMERFHIEDSKNCSNDFLEIFDWNDHEWVSLGRKCGRNNPDTISSTSNKMKVLFRTNDENTASGFKAMWEWQCGGTFWATKEPRILVSAGYPVTYDGNLNCKYVIKTKTDIISLRFLDFDVESGGSDCNYDNVSISGRNLDGYSFLSNYVYCGDKLPPPQRSKGTVTITLKTDRWYYGRGFKLEYKDESCGGTITEETVIDVKRIINGLARYNHPRMECFWNITAPPKQIVVLSIRMVRMYQSTMCLGQSVQIFEGLTTDRQSRLAQLCGNIDDEYPISSKSNKMLVKLVALPVTFKAEIRFSHGVEEGCGGVLNLTDTMHIESPYLNNLDCGWKIIAPKDRQIEISITELNLSGVSGDNNTSCSYSSVEIRDGGGPFSEKIEQLCPNSNSTTTKYPTITSSRNTAYVRLVLREKKENAFKATLKPVMSVCGPTLLYVNKTIQTLTSPGFPNPYPPNIKCTYILSTYTSLERISLHFLEFDLKNDVRLPEGKRLTRCDGDNIKIFEDPHNKEISEGLGPGTIYSTGSNQIALSYNDVRGRHVFCGKDEKPFDYYSSGSSLTLTLYSTDSTNKGSGFKLEYSTAGCNRNYTELQGRIFNGNDKSECFVSIIVPENRTISLYFNTFYFFNSVNCTNANFEVRDGSPTGMILLRACGYRVPDPIFSYSNKLYIHGMNKRPTPLMMRYDFAYTSTLAGRGCGGELYNNKGNIYSPMYPNPFRNSTTCTWLVRVPVGLHTVLKFIVFDIQGSCEQTSVKVTTYDDFGGSLNTLELCQDYQPGPIIRSQSSIEIKYTSSIHNGGTGWFVQFQAVSKDVTHIY